VVQPRREDEQQVVQDQRLVVHVELDSFVVQLDVGHLIKIKGTKAVDWTSSTDTTVWTMDKEVK
jgi:hypothetical protein